MDKAEVKDLLKEMFKNNEIEVRLEKKDGWNHSNLTLSILIDDKEVYKCEETLDD